MQVQKSDAVAMKSDGTVAHCHFALKIKAKLGMGAMQRLQWGFASLCVALRMQQDYLALKRAQCPFE